MVLELEPVDSLDELPAVVESVDSFDELPAVEGAVDSLDELPAVEGAVVGGLASAAGGIGKPKPEES